MFCAEENIITGVEMRNVSNDQQQTVVAFRAHLECKEDVLEDIYKTIVGKILGGRDVLVVTKKDQLMDLISDAVEEIHKNYVSENALKVASFIPQPASSVEHHATLVKKIPLSVAKDLAISTEFIYGNLWFLISSSDANECRDDITKLTPSTFNELPILQHETVAAPAMYDGLEILWFKPNKDIYQNLIKPLFEN